MLSLVIILDDQSSECVPLSLGVVFEAREVAPKEGYDDGVPGFADACTVNQVLASELVPDQVIELGDVEHRGDEAKG